MLSLQTLFALLLAPSVVLSHFTLDYPTSRGFDEDIEPNFCGGFPNVSTTRSLFPLSNGPIQIYSAHPSADVAIFISFADNPTNFGQFNATNGTGYGPLMNFTTVSGVGDFCFNTNVAALNLPNVSNGTLATIQVEFNGGDGILLQCTDIILSSTFTAPANETCASGVQTVASSASGGIPTGTATASAVSASATAPKSPAGRVEVGWTLGALMIVGVGLMM